MHLRLPFWAVLFVCAFGCLHAQPTPAPGGATAPAAGMTNGQIVAKMVTGKVTMELNGAIAEVVNDTSINPGATVTTAADASVILVFSNGATTQLGPDSSLVIEQFLQSPFKQAVSLATATQEPSTSRTKLKLNKGELLGKVAKLKHDQGSTFEVQTPVGAAGIRGTTFRLVFRPTGTGQAFAVFSLSTLEGNVNFQQGAAGAPGTPTPGTPTTPTAPGQPEAGVPVVTGQEVVVTLAVEVSASGQVTITAPPVVTSAQPMSVETQAAIARQAEAVATAAATATFPPTPTTGGNEGGPTAGEGEGEGDGEGDGEGEGNATGGGDTPAGEGNSGNSSTANEGDANAGQNNASENANNTNANNANAGSGNNANTGDGNAGTPPASTPPPSNSQPPSNSAPPASPGPTTNIPRTTPGDGRPGS